MTAIKAKTFNSNPCATTTPNYADQAIAQWSTNHNILL